MDGQMTMFDWLEQLEGRPKEPEVGEWVESHGAVICHIMRPAYIGQKVVVDLSTESHSWYKVGILEKYIPYERTYRSVVYDGKKQRQLITHRPGIEIYECLPWEAYPERMKAIGRRNDDKR